MVNCVLSVGVMFQAVNNVVSDIVVGSQISLSFKLLTNKMPALPFFKCALILEVKVKEMLAGEGEGYLQPLWQVQPLWW